MPLHESCTLGLRVIHGINLGAQVVLRIERQSPLGWLPTERRPGLVQAVLEDVPLIILLLVVDDLYNSVVISLLQLREVASGGRILAKTLSLFEVLIVGRLAFGARIVVFLVFQIQHLRLVARISLVSFPQRRGFCLVQVELELVFLGLILVLRVQGQGLASSRQEILGSIHAALKGTPTVVQRPGSTGLLLQNNRIEFALIVLIGTYRVIHDNYRVSVM